MIKWCQFCYWVHDETCPKYEEQIDKMLAESSTLPQCLMDESLDEELGT